MSSQSTYKPNTFSSQNKPKNTPVFQSDSSGKEKDSETGYHYFGARYYNSDLSIWLSVDPMADKNPSISPYGYCSWNPMRLIDPDGRDDWEVDKLGYMTRCKEQPENPTEDRIRVKGSDGWTDKNSLTGLSLGTLSEQRGEIKNGASGSRISLHGSREDNVNVFMFCSDNTHVEYSLMEVSFEEQTYSYLTTSHQERRVGIPSTDNFGTELAKENSLYLISHLHNHVGSANPSGDFFIGDISFRNEIEKRRNSQHISIPVLWGIYKCQGNDRQQSVNGRSVICRIFGIRMFGNIHGYHYVPVPFVQIFLGKIEQGAYYEE